MSPSGREATLVEALERAERALDEGRGLEGTGFWGAVSRARRDPALAGRHAERIARIDRAAFERGVRIRVPAWVGTALLAGGSAVGIAAVGVAGRLDEVVAEIVFLVGLGALLVSTHSLAHWIVGRAVGIRFTHYFLGGPPPPRPGAKTDYASYLRTPARSRALMHASGAVVTKIVPFALVPVALAADLWGGIVVLLLAVGALGILTDVVFSTKSSDWKKVRRELRAARR